MQLFEGLALPKRCKLTRCLSKSGKSISISPHTIGTLTARTRGQSRSPREVQWANLLWTD
jgi:hypothetical protein